MRSIDEIKRNEKLKVAQQGMTTLNGYITLSTGAKGSFVMGMIEGGISEHVSVRLFKNRLPTWNEMCEVKDIFWEDEEEAIQIHPKKSEYVDFLDALHLWKPIDNDWNRLMREGR